MSHEPTFEYTQAVAICTLASDDLREKLSAEAALEGILVGGLTTENIGIEQMIEFSVTHPHLRFIVLCGEDAQQAIGHLPGQSLLALAQNGIDADGRMIGAKGKRPVIQNLPHEAIDHFRNQVTVVDMIGCEESSSVLETVHTCMSKNLGPVEAFELTSTVPTVHGYVPDTMIPDPKGYVVISVDNEADCIVLEHYDKKGCQTVRIEGKTATEVYFPVIEEGLVALLDHAAYLGRELYRAELALNMGKPYVQDDLGDFLTHF